MTRTPVDSSNIHSIAHDATGLWVQFHGTKCARRDKSADAETACDCRGGGVYHYPMVTREEHEALMAAESIGSHFMKHIRNAKGADGKAKHPGTFIPEPV